MLGKLQIPDEVDVDKIRTLKLLMHTLNLVQFPAAFILLKLNTMIAPTTSRQHHE